MRKGKLIIEKANKFKPGDRYFDTGAKIMITVKAVESGVIIGETHVGQPCRVHTENLVEIIVEDTVTNEKFDLTHDQCYYMYRTVRDRQFMFFTKIDTIKKFQYAIVMAKNNELNSVTNDIAPIADTYGIYVASQKSINEPAKNFKDWYFDVSV